MAAGRAQRWSHSKTLLITALAGTGHVLTTALLGLILTIFGVALTSRIGTDISSTRTSDWVAIGSLLAMLTFSPCEAFLPIYVSGIRFGWGGFALLTLILSTAAVAGMLVFTSLALLGIRSIGLGWFERYESLVMGSLLLLVGVMVLLFEK